jgi:hypothetical protein
MRLEGSCHCGRVRFRLHAEHPYPFNLCYCSICRKTAGGGSVYHAVMRDAAGAPAGESPAERHFCRHCASALWVWDPRWPDLVHPFASAIDTELPAPPERTHLMLASKAAWVPVLTEAQDQSFDAYPDESIADWHQRLGLEG